MNLRLRQDANYILTKAVDAVKPDAAVKRALAEVAFEGDVYIVAAGKAAYQMAKVVANEIPFKAGVVVTKYNHVLSDIEGMTCFEAGHPVPDENGFMGTKAALDMTSNLTEKDTVLFLLSGGGSALFESPLIRGEELQSITNELLRCGADITEINILRKRLSAVKGGKFAEHVAPAKVYAVILSDIIGDPIDMIASGPTVVDASTCEDAVAIVNKYNLKLTEEAMNLLQIETPKQITNAINIIIGSVRELCHAATAAARERGYEVIFLSDCITCEARDLGNMLGAIAKSNRGCKKKAFVCGGETVVHLKGTGLGGRNQEIAVAAMEQIAGLENVCVFSVGSDGTDGPTDAAGGYVDGSSMADATMVGIDVPLLQNNNDCYHILKAIDGLVITGPTGTNVNDFSMVLIDGD